MVPAPMSAMSWTWIFPCALAISTPYALSETLLSEEDCAGIVLLAHVQGLRPSFEKERALQSLFLQTRAAFGLQAFDFDGTGDLNVFEVAAAARSILNAPLFSSRDARSWIWASTGKQNLSLAWLAHEDHLASLAFHSREAFAQILERHPEKLTRHSFQTSLPWTAAKSLAPKLVAVAKKLLATSSGSPTELEAESLQVIRYPKYGHYAPHSDA